MKRMHLAAAARTALLVAFASALGSCASAPAEPPATTFPPPTCHRPPGPKHPDTQATLTEREADEMWCLHVGDTVVVQLTVPATQPPEAWPEVESSNPHALVALGDGPVTTPDGTVAVHLEARQAGPVQIRVEGGEDQTWVTGVLITD